MNSDQIFILLNRASQENCSQTERSEIFSQLNTSLSHKKEIRAPKEEKNCISCVQTLLSRIYWGTIDNHPEVLVFLFPLFDCLCSSNDSNTIFSRINWKCFEEYLSQEDWKKIEASFQKDDPDKE